jgi:hypothetical protein
LSDCQQDYHICHLIQVEGQKKLLDEIKASLKQAVYIPLDYNGLGTQSLLFAATSTIFFGDESICTTNLQQLLLLISRNKKSFRDQIAINIFLQPCFSLPSTGGFDAGSNLANKPSILAQKLMTASSNSTTSSMKS